MEPNSLVTLPEAHHNRRRVAVWLGALVLVLVAIYVFIFNKNNFLGTSPDTESPLVPSTEVQNTILEKVTTVAGEQAPPPAEQKKVIDKFNAQPTPPPPTDSQKQQIINGLNAH